MLWVSKYYTISVVYWGPQSWWNPQSYISWHLFHQLCSRSLHLSHLWSLLHHPPVPSLCSEPPQALLSPFIIHCFSVSTDCCGSLAQSSKTVCQFFLSSDPSSPKLPLVFPSCVRSYWNCWDIPITTKGVSSRWQGHSLSPTCSKILMWLWSN